MGAGKLLVSDRHVGARRQNRKKHIKGMHEATD